jgi:hypothetical protein
MRYPVCPQLGGFCRRKREPYCNNGNGKSAHLQTFLLKLGRT